MAFPPPLSHLSRFSCAVGGKDRRRRSSVCGGGTGTPPTEGFAPSVSMDLFPHFDNVKKLPELEPASRSCKWFARAAFPWKN